MKILIINNMVPFVWGGAEELAVHLQKNIQLAGHEAEMLRIPFQWKPAVKIPSQILMCKKFELSNVDKVIALKFPAYIIRHPDKVIWLLHQYRQAYDLFDSGQTNLPSGKVGEKLRQIIRTSDNETFSDAKKIFTNSEITQARLKHYNGFDSDVLFPPLNDAELFSGGELGQYIFAGGRVNTSKRQHLLIEALALTKNNVQLVIAGPPDDAAYAEKLYTIAAQSGVTDRVKLDLRFLPRTEIAHYVNNALACAYIPYDEDSLGYVSMEAANAGKALITTKDSGGILGIAKEKITGWVTDQNAKAIAHAMDDATCNRDDTGTRGKAAKQLWESFGISWENTIKRLLL